MRDGPVARQFENIDMPRDVRMDIGGRVFDRIADAGLPAEMDDPLNGVAGERVGERVGLAKIDIDQGAQLTIAGQGTSDARALAHKRILGRELVHAQSRKITVKGTSVSERVSPGRRVIIRKTRKKN